MCVLTRDAAIEVLTALTCAPITRTIRGIGSEVKIGTGERLIRNQRDQLRILITLPVEVLDAVPVGHLGLEARVGLDRALRYALDIQY